ARPGAAALRYMPVPQQPAPIDLDTEFLAEPVHHRWLLTTCIVGTAATLIVGGALLGLFGQNRGPSDALAAVQATASTSLVDPIAEIVSPVSSTDLKAAQGMAPPLVEVVPERDLSDRGGEFNYPEITADALPYGDGKTVGLDAEIEAAEAENENITTFTKTPPAEPVDESIKITSGKSLTEELMERGVSREAATALMDAIEPVFPTRLLRPGMKLDVTFDRQQNFYGRDVIFPVEVSFKPGPKETVTVEADEDGHFSARVDGREPAAPEKPKFAEITQFRTKTQVGSGLYGTAKDNRIPDYIISELTRAFSYDVDFQRQVKATDSFEVFYGNPLTGSSAKRKVMHYAKLTFEGREKAYFRFTDARGNTDYYDENGRGASKSLLRMPVSGARLTSGFGMRRHPLLGYSKMHTGVDFGAPSGTPIRAAGSGTIKLSGRHGAYGNAVTISHNGEITTLYAHMSRIAAGIRPGARVNQGQIIGYVGSTGRSTGPHLHYEVRLNDRPMNPQSVRASGAKQLAGKDLARFRVLKNKVYALMKNAPSATQVAQNTP
ncbi:MAG TPA: peptidoglycan DD-metalloendopeptidase family protein, partial [Aestuariivirga sp.]|nr:peptidoglycan DD-metalloendopeptidase family protein [Aestuariivirga sp.]